MAEQAAPGLLQRLFGFQLKDIQKSRENKEKLPSIVPPNDEEGSGYSGAAGGHFAQHLNIDGNDAKNNAQLINQYRGVSMHPEVDDAIDNIVNEAISAAEDQSSVELKMDDVKVSAGVKKKITEEFEGIVSMLNFNELGHDIFRRWYIDGRLYHHLVVDKNREKEGIVDIRPVDAAKIRKIKEIKTKKDPVTSAKIVEGVTEYFIYQEKPGQQMDGIKMTHDSVSYVTSGLLDAERKRVISYLHKALKPVNQLRMMEDSLVIYRLARAPERRIFYIDIGNLPRGKADQYMKDVMAKYRNKIVYDAETGALKDDRKHMSMLEDFWLPRREGGRGTEITTLPGGDNLGQIEDIIYFQKKLYRALNVPISRMDTENTPFSIGRSNEISRDELRFQKFIDRLRMRFSALFLGILQKQLILKGIITEEDWDAMKNNIVVNFIRDNYFTELKDGEILRERIQTLTLMTDFKGVYFSKNWIMKNVLRFNDDEIEKMQKEMDAEKLETPEEDPMYQQGQADAQAQSDQENADITKPGPAAPAAPPTVKHKIDVNVKNEEFEVETPADVEIELMKGITSYLKGL